MSDQATTLRRLMMAEAGGKSDHQAKSRSPRANKPQARGNTSRRARILAVASGKGGMGKTSITVNMAACLAGQGRRVVLLDADLGTANADILCNINHTRTLADVVTGRYQLHEVLISASGGFWLIPGASGLAQAAALSQVDRAGLIEQMRCLEAVADVILIDTGSGIGHNLLGLLADSDLHLVVTTPQPTALVDAYALIKSLHRQVGKTDIRLLVNMVNGPAQADAVYQRIGNVCQRFLGFRPKFAGHLPVDASLVQAIYRRRPFMLDAADSAAAVCIGQIVKRLNLDDRSEPGVDSQPAWQGGSQRTHEAKQGLLGRMTQ